MVIQLVYFCPGNPLETQGVLRLSEGGRRQRCFAVASALPGNETATDTWSPTLQAALGQVQVQRPDRTGDCIRFAAAEDESYPVYCDRS